MTASDPPRLTLTLSRRDIRALRRLLEAPDATRLTRPQLEAVIRIRREIGRMDHALTALSRARLVRDDGRARLHEAPDGAFLVEDRETGRVHAETPFTVAPDPDALLAWLTGAAAEAA